jgi:Kef-type K+ transport system membrane component KefB
MTSAATTVTAHKQELLLYFTLLEVAVIVLAGRLGDWAARWVGQSGVVGQILIGILLGPSLFGLISPQAFDYLFRTAPPEPMQILSGLGLVLLMFQIGLEFEFTHLTERTNRRVVLSVASLCLVVPFAIGLGLGYVAAPVLSPSANRLHSALFVATAFSITALPILGRMMIELDITRTALAVIAISAAAINDVIGWLLLALITAITAGAFNGGNYGLRVLLVGVYAVVCVVAVRPVAKAAIRRANPGEHGLSPNLIGGVLTLIFLSALVTYQLGIFAIFGGFMMGVILFDEPQLVRAWRSTIGQFVNVFFLPIFFTYTGLRTSIGTLTSLADWEWCAVTVGLATIAKFGAAYVGARLAGRSHAESVALGYMMNTRALMELIVLNIGYDLGVISPRMFTMLVLMAVFSTVITIPALRRYLPRAGIPFRDVTGGKPPVIGPRYTGAGND